MLMVWYLVCLLDLFSVVWVCFDSWLVVLYEFAFVFVV